MISLIITFNAEPAVLFKTLGANISSTIATYVHCGVNAADLTNSPHLQLSPMLDDDLRS